MSADTDPFNKAMDQSESRLASVAKTMGKAGLVGAAAGLAGALKVGVGEFMATQKVTAQTNAVLKSTGGVANVSMKAVQDLSESLMKKSGVDDEAIQSGQNMLLTFTNVRNEAGKGNRVFDQATKTLLDMSVAMGTDMKGQAIQLGKALNDPIRGVSALSEVGVTFTDAQRSSIKAMQEAGDTMGAQKLILAELNKEFGGSAEAAGKTFGGQIDIAKESLTNLAGEGIGKLMPHLTGLAGWITGTGLPKLKDLADGLSGNNSIKAAFDLVRSNINNLFIPVIKGIVEVFRTVFNTVKEVLDSKKEEMKTIFDGMAAAAKVIGSVFTEVIVPALKLVFKKDGPFDLAFGLAIEIVAGLITAIGKIVGGVTATFKAVNKYMNDTAVPAFEKAWGLIKEPVDAVLSAIRSIVDAIKDVIEWLGKIKVPKIPGLGSSAADVGFPPEGSEPVARAVAGVSNKLWDEVALGQGMGLTLTSGLRPGDPGDHGRGHAIDMAGPASAMATFAMAAMGRPGVKDVIYGGLPFWMDNGRRVTGWGGNEALRSDHFDHAHVSVFDKGGWLPPKSATLAINRTSMWEPVGPPQRQAPVINVTVNGWVGNDQQIAERIRLIFQKKRNIGVDLGFT